MLATGPRIATFGGPRFELRRQLGAGATAVVYEAFDRHADRLVALKTTHPGAPAHAHHLRREFARMRDVTHPNLVRRGELFEADGGCFFTMELVVGAPFVEHVRARPDRLRDALTQLTRGLAALHAAGLVHRDVKPSNVLVTPAGRVVLLDFGLVAEVDEPGRGGDTDAVGTVAYMAPEQALGRAVGPEADWYSVGVMLYEALAGRLPLSGAQARVIVDKQRVMPAGPATLAPGTPVDLDRLCSDLLAI